MQPCASAARLLASAPVELRAVVRVTASGQGQAKFCMLFRFRISGWPTALVNSPVSLDSCCFSNAGARTNVEGSSQSGAYHSRHNLVFGGSSGTVTMMQACASAAKLRATDPFCARHHSHGLDRVTATSTRHRPLARVEAAGGEIGLCRCSVQLLMAGRRSTPCGISPAVANRQSAMRSLRASATIMVFRRLPAVTHARYHCDRALSLW